MSRAIAAGCLLILPPGPAGDGVPQQAGDVGGTECRAGRERIAARRRRPFQDAPPAEPREAQLEAEPAGHQIRDRTPLVEEEPGTASHLVQHLPPRLGPAPAARSPSCARSRPETSRVCLVAITGWGAPEDRARTREAGFNHHLTKPVDPEELIQVIAQCA